MSTVKKIMLLVALVALACMVAAPAAFANDKQRDRIDTLNNRIEDLEDDLDDPDFDDLSDLLDDLDDNALVDQSADSGDIDQSFEVINTGDNANQCVGIDGTANTGNVQDATPLFITGDFDGDGDFEVDSAADLNVDGTSTTTCDQVVDQEATVW